MQNVTVLLFVESRYQVNRKRIKKQVSDALNEQGMSKPVELSVAIVGDRKMRALNKKYRHIDKTTNVLSFPLTEGGSSQLPSDTLHLGDVVVSYPQVIADAARDEMMVDDKVDELIGHGLMHLLGLHHE